ARVSSFQCIDARFCLRPLLADIEADCRPAGACSVRKYTLLQLSTGSRIAYSEFDPPPGMRVRADPIVFLHGGPGLRQAPFDQRIYGSLSKEGFRVFLFDQAGSGLSNFLPHV